jgi:nicotinamidase-related amidase
VKNTVLPGNLSYSPAEIARRRNVGLPLDVTIDNTPGQEFLDEIAPAPGDAVVSKQRMDSFYGSHLETVLRAHGIETVVCTGVATYGCVTGTSYAAQARDYNVVVVSDCVAAFSETLHEAALVVLSHTMGHVVDSETLTRVWNGELEPSEFEQARRGALTAVWIDEE